MGRAGWMDGQDGWDRSAGGISGGTGKKDFIEVIYLSSCLRSSVPLETTCQIEDWGPERQVLGRVNGTRCGR